MLSCAKQLFQIPIHKAHLSRPLALDVGMLQIAANGNLPRNIDEGTCSPEKAAGDPLRANSQALSQGKGLHAGDRHSLAVDRIKTAQAIAKHEKALWEPGQLLVVPAQICGKTIWSQWRQRLGVSDDLEDLRFLQAAGEFDVAGVVGGRVVTEIPAERHDPAILL